ncbi:hypothetical protein ADL12_12400 [Streptomyces regalis]|uniref:Uncharacterized protein n=1 Tax=Streptomyces regalis TaxID=68262 RepID=A0A0X3V9X5_9ACTN|nr:hypothetical protein [Streptomyces regalis]KUL41062.1 hypothetical protein ADL12_12400 [Streptomyces regalis]
MLRNERFAVAAPPTCPDSAAEGLVVEVGVFDDYDLKAAPECLDACLDRLVKVEEGGAGGSEPTVACLIGKSGLRGLVEDEEARGTGLLISANHSCRLNMVAGSPDSSARFHLGHLGGPRSGVGDERQRLRIESELLSRSSWTVLASAPSHQHP